MNLAELNFLNHHDLSHAARSLYLLYLRLKAERGEVIATQMEISNFLGSSSKVQETPCDFEFCAKVLEELKEHGLIEFQDKDCAPFGKITLPLFEQEANNLPAPPFKMHDEWRPGPSFIHVAKLSGLANADFTEAELQAFINYWESKNEMRNQSAWERTFCQRLLRKRSAKVSMPRAKASFNVPELREIKAQTPKFVAQKSKFS